MRISVLVRTICLRCSDWYVASVLTVCLRRDPVFCYFFQSSIVGRIALWSFLRDETIYRRKTGRVLVAGPTVAIVGISPHELMPNRAISRIARLFISRQGESWRQTWSSADDLHGCAPTPPYTYLSAIGTLPWFRGRGRASKVLARLASMGMTICLETGSPSAKDLYLSRGFTLKQVLDLPGGPSVWILWGEPA